MWTTYVIRSHFQYKLLWHIWSSKHNICLHMFCKCFTCVLHVFYMYFICVLHVFYMYLICVFYVFWYVFLCKNICIYGRLPWGLPQCLAFGLSYSLACPELNRSARPCSEHCRINSPPLSHSLSRWTLVKKKAAET